jgi:hypothetical protein
MATSELAPQPVSFYAAVFFLVNATYVGLIWELIDEGRAPAAARKAMRWRALITLALFGAAMVLALWWPIEGLMICIACLAVYLRPEVRG